LEIQNASFLHGELKQSFLSLHVIPENCSEHWHIALTPLLIQVALFLQGVKEHGSIISHFGPFLSGGQSHVGMPFTKLHVPPLQYDVLHSVTHSLQLYPEQ